MSKEHLFTNTAQFTYEDLPPHTRERMFEIELAIGLHALKVINKFNNQKAANNLLALLQIPVAQRAPYHDAIATYRFRRPQKMELVDFLRYNGYSYKKVHEMTGASPNTISKRRYVLPDYYPIIEWSSTSRKAWEQVKNGLNMELAFKERIF